MTLEPASFSRAPAWNIWSIVIVEKSLSNLELVWFIHQFNNHNGTRHGMVRKEIIRISLNRECQNNINVLNAYLP